MRDTIRGLDPWGSTSRGGRVARVRDACSRFQGGIVLAIVVLFGGFVLGLAVHRPRPSAGVGSTPFSFTSPDVMTLATHNLVVTAVLVAGALTLGAVTLSALFYNGFLLGTVAKSLLWSGLSPTQVVLLVAPHGVFELPGLLIAGGIGLKFAANGWRYLLERRQQPIEERELRDGTLALTVAVLCILTAAPVELHLTPQLVSL
ncbi:stage II sporulation protein M [Haloarculaceae archaeon H-GB11]|nr:stage II sporulation protein M [Haloarculaceae archaeon H-GB1-1]MEA5387506.1 stage II sporulation protein M [Haloarculaceae archaeon H-GB11]